MYGAERFIKDSGDKLTAADRQAIESAADRLKKAIESNEVAAISREMESLTEAQHKAAANLYQQAGAAGSGQTPGGDAGAGGASSAGAGGPGPAPSGDVIDAEVVDDK